MQEAYTGLPSVSNAKSAKMERGLGWNSFGSTMIPPAFVTVELARVDIQLDR